MNTFKKDIRGITLIAIVITIIALLILAEVTLSILVGNNRILTMALDSKNISIKSTEIEQINLALQGFQISCPNEFNKDKFENEFFKIGFKNPAFVYTEDLCYFTSDTKNVYTINLSSRTIVDKNIVKLHNEKITDTKRNIEIIGAWIDSNTAEFTIDGNVSTNTYINLSKDAGIIIKDTSQELSLKKALFKSEDTVFIQYNYISGIAPTNTFTIKFRDTSKDSVAINTAELIANHSKQNFELTKSFKNSGTLSTDVSSISIYIANGCTFENFRFTLTFGKE